VHLFSVGAGEHGLSGAAGVPSLAEAATSDCDALRP
jgi:hypothetical protein